MLEDGPVQISMIQLILALIIFINFGVMTFMSHRSGLKMAYQYSATIPINVWAFKYCNELPQSSQYYSTAAITHVPHNVHRVRK